MPIQARKKHWLKSASNDIFCQHFSIPITNLRNLLGGRPARVNQPRSGDRLQPTAQAVGGVVERESAPEGQKNQSPRVHPGGGSISTRLREGRANHSDKLRKNKKSSELAFAALRAGTLPRYFAGLAYCNGVTPWQAVSLPIAAVVELARTTASSNEQKVRTPVWFAVIGVAAQ
jgi:hypothetical protein